MSREWREQDPEHQDSDVREAPRLSPGKRSGTSGAPDSPPPAYPGKRTLTQHLSGPVAVQRRATGTTTTTRAPVAVAQGATQGGGGRLPHLDAIQRSFGRHDVSAIRAHVGGEAAGAADALGARAFAVGDAVAFAAPPDLHTAAHEAAHVVQQRRGAVPAGSMDGGPGDAQERLADQVADAVVRGESAEHLLGPVGDARAAAANAAVQRKTKVTPVAAGLKDKLTVLGDGTAANPGLSIPDFDAYLRAQADWFTHPDFASGATAAADRDAVWKVARLVGLGFHTATALANLHVGEVSGADLKTLARYVQCFDGETWTVQLGTPAPTLARAIQLGKAVDDLLAFVDPAVLKIVIPEDGLAYLVDHGKLTELEKYYTTFHPTLETPDEWDHVKEVLDEGVATYAALAPWIHDVHVFTKNTRQQLLKNIADKSRALPVTLILFSAVDWNTAFLQGVELEKIITDTRRLALVVQGVASVKAAAAEVDRVANDYGQRSLTWDPKKSWWPQLSPGRLGQVVIAGHGSDQSVEMGSPGTGSWADDSTNNVEYDQDRIDSGNDPKGNGTELLFDTVIKRMDPNDVDIVFAGCLVNSHDVPAGTPISSTAAEAQKNLQDALKKHPNLADYVRSRIAAAGAKGTVKAANASATFDSFRVDPATGKATIASPDEPDLGGTKLEYLRTGIEPEGALRAAIECYADAAIGPATTTSEIKTKLGALAGNTGWWESITRVAFELCMPASGDVDPVKLNDVVHRVGPWFEMLWDDESDPQRAADVTKAAEAPKVFAAMLGTANGAEDHIAFGANECWSKYDRGKATDAMTALDASSFTQRTFEKHVARGVLDPQLSTLLPKTATPSKGQLLLALTIAAQDGAKLPRAVRDLLRAAAGGAKTASFPAALNVPTLLDKTPELTILEAIGLAPHAAPTTGGGSVDGNVDVGGDGTNESFVEVAPRFAKVTAPAELNVRARPSGSATIVDTVKHDDVVRVMGTTIDGAWSMIDHGGKIGFVASKYVA